MGGGESGGIKEARKLSLKRMIDAELLWLEITMFTGIKKEACEQSEQ